MSNFIEDFSEKVSLADNDLMIIADSQANNQNKKSKFSTVWNYIKNKLESISFKALNLSAGENSLKSKNCIAYGSNADIPTIMNACEAFNSGNVSNLPMSNNYKYHATIINNVLKGTPDETFIISSPANNQTEFSVTYHPCLLKIYISSFLVIVDKSGLAIEKTSFDCSGYIDLDNRTYLMTEMRNIVSLKEKERLLPFCSKLIIYPTFISSETYKLLLNIPNLDELAMNWFNTGTESFKEFKLYSSFVIRTQELYGSYVNKKGKE